MTKENSPCNFEECGFNYTLALINGKYKMSILYCLFRYEIVRYNELKRFLSSISFKTLTNTLRELENDGLIIRKEYAQIPPKVEYSLSKRGQSLIPILQAMSKWGKKDKKGEKMLELIGELSLQNYMGEWLEMARKPAFFQKSCLNSKAKYELKYKNGIPYVEIKNFCSKKNEISSIKGKAKIVSNRQLAVRFNIFMNLFNKVNYEIIFVDSEYKVAIVGSPDKKYLWILARNIIDEKNIKELLNIAKQRGFDISDVVFDKY